MDTIADLPDTGQALSQKDGKLGAGITKICKGTKHGCGRELPIENFAVNKKSGRPNAICRMCQNEVSAQWRRDNPEKSKACSAKWKAENPEAQREYVRAWQEINRNQWISFFGRKALVCQLCGYSRCFAAMDFHHLFPELKRLEIGSLILRVCDEVNRKEVERELKICALLCSTCHRELEHCQTRMATEEFDKMWGHLTPFARKPTLEEVMSLR